MEGVSQDSHTVPGVGFPQGGSPKPKRRTSLIVFIILGILFLAGGAVFFISRSNEEIVSTPTPTGFFESQPETPTPEPSPTPSPVSKSEVRIEVLNGIGVPGEAAYLQGQLRSLGFTNITAGNADTDAATATQVTFSPIVSQAIMDEIEQRLRTIYSSVTTSSSSLSNTDVRIVTGPRRGATQASPAATSAASASPSATPTTTN